MILKRKLAIQSILIILVMILQIMIPCLSFAEDDVLGTWNVSKAEQDNVVATLYNSGLLVIEGTGEMVDNGYNGYPWEEFTMNIKSVEIKEGVTNIPSRAFSYCTSLKTVKIPNGVTTIGEYAFGDCSKLESIEIPNSVTTIGSSVFEYCTSLKIVKIPDGVTSIDLGWYSGEKMEDVKVIIVPDSVEELPNNFCYKMTGLEAVYLGNNIISIPTSTFARCYYLQFIHLPEELAEIGYGAFQFAMSLPEMYFPSTVESIGTKAFWTSGIRNYNLPKNLMNVASDGICYPPIAGGIWDEPDAQSPEMKADITSLMNLYQFNKNNVIITTFGPNLALASTSSFTASNYQVTGAQVHVRAPSFFETTVFEGKKSKWNTYKYFDNMSMSEIAARAQVAVDHVLLLKTATEQQVEAAINDAYYTNTEKTLSWVEPYTVTDGVATGIVKLSSGDTFVNLLLNRKIYTPPVSSGSSILKGDKSDIKLDINFDESLFGDDSDEKDIKDDNIISDTSNDKDNNVDFDKEDTKENNADFDSFDDKDEIVVESDKGEATVEIRINKVPKNKLEKNILSKLEGYPYVVFDLSLYSEQTIELKGKLGVLVPLPKGFDGNLCSIYYITEDGKFVDMDAKMYGKDMAFYTSVVGRYVLVMDGTDYTPINIAVGVGGGVLLVGIATLVILLIIRKRRKAK